MPDFISPHIATFGRYDWEKRREDEGCGNSSCTRPSSITEQTKVDESVRESLPDLLREFGFTARSFSSAEEFLASEDVGQTNCLNVYILLTKSWTLLRLNWSVIKNLPLNHSEFEVQGGQVCCIEPP